MQCPKCGSINEDKILICDNCKVELESATVNDKSERQEDLITIVKTMDKQKVESVEKTLSDNGIYCKLLNFTTVAVGNGGICLPIEIQVERDENNKALEILQQNGLCNNVNAKKDENKNEQHISNTQKEIEKQIIVRKSNVVLNIMLMYMSFMAIVEIVCNNGNQIGLGAIIEIFMFMFLFCFGMLALKRGFVTKQKTISA